MYILSLITPPIIATFKSDDCIYICACRSQLHCIYTVHTSCLRHWITVILSLLYSQLLNTIDNLQGGVGDASSQGPLACSSEGLEAATCTVPTPEGQQCDDHSPQTLDPMQQQQKQQLRACPPAAKLSLALPLLDDPHARARTHSTMHTPTTATLDAMLPSSPLLAGNGNEKQLLLCPFDEGSLQPSNASHVHQTEQPQARDIKSSGHQLPSSNNAVLLSSTAASPDPSTGHTIKQNEEGKRRVEGVCVDDAGGWKEAEGVKEKRNLSPVPRSSSETDMSMSLSTAKRPPPQPHHRVHFVQSSLGDSTQRKRPHLSDVSATVKKRKSTKDLPQ